ncbi:hypothetical protein CsatB_017933 [Cannabis sativa]
MGNMVVGKIKAPQMAESVVVVVNSEIVAVAKYLEIVVARSSGIVAEIDPGKSMDFVNRKIDPEKFAALDPRKTSAAEMNSQIGPTSAVGTVILQKNQSKKMEETGRSVQTCLE